MESASTHWLPDPLDGQAAESGAESFPPCFGKYQIRRALGQGGQATALLAWDPDLRRQVVVKIYHSARTESERNAVLQEGQALARVRSPYVAQCFGAERHEGIPYLVVEFVEGSTLAEVNRTHPLAVPRAVELLTQVAEGVDAIHACGLLHRDLKPSNILIAPDGKPQLVDFGLAAAIGSEQLRQISGTPAYMAPEQARGETSLIDQRTDVFGLGAVFYELLTGRPPYLGESLESVWSQARAGDILPAIERTHGLKREVSQACMRCLEKDPAKRFGSASQLRDALEQLRDGRRWNVSLGFGRLRFRLALGVSVAMLLLAYAALRFGGDEIGMDGGASMRRLAYLNPQERIPSAAPELTAERASQLPHPAPMAASVAGPSHDLDLHAAAPPRRGSLMARAEPDESTNRTPNAFFLTMRTGELLNADEQSVDWAVPQGESLQFDVRVVKPGVVSVWREAENGDVNRLWPVATPREDLVGPNEWLVLDAHSSSSPNRFLHVFHDSRTGDAEPQPDRDISLELGRLSGDASGTGRRHGAEADVWERAIDYGRAIPGIEYRRVRVRILPKSSADPP